MIALAVVFWASAGLLAHTHVTYPLTLLVLDRLRRGGKTDGAKPVATEMPTVSLVVAAHNEEAVIGERVRNALALEYPRELLQVIVASDGSSDRTVELAREAGADVVLDLPRGGKVAAQDAAAIQATGTVLAFSDANSMWETDALRALVAALADPGVGYVCGRLRLTGEGGENQEGAYWRYETAVRALESRLGGVTAGNGAIYAVPRDAYVPMAAEFSHDLCLPHLAVRAGRRPLYESGAVARERMAPTLGGEWQRKRRMMNRTWGIVLGGGLLRPRGLGLAYGYEMFSHRALRYASPFLHMAAFAACLALAGEGAVYVVALALQLAVLAAAALGRFIPLLPLRIASYYVAVTASILAGLVDRVRSGPAATWEPVAETRDPS